jgi:hypothetical protein
VKLANIIFVIIIAFSSQLLWSEGFRIRILLFGLDGARPANTFISLSFPENMPEKPCSIPTPKSTFVRIKK